MNFLRLTITFCTLISGLTGSAQLVTFINENFNSGFPASWTRINNDGLTPATPVAFVTNAWVAFEDTDSTGIGDSVAVATSYYTSAGTADDWMISPAIILKHNGNILEWEAKSEDPSYPDGYDVLISNTLPVLDSFYANSKLFFTDFEYPDWTRRSVSLDSFANDTVYIAFRAKTTDHFLLLIDNIYIYADTVLSVNQPEFAKLDVQVYPNPALEAIFISGSANLESIMITDLDGRCLYYEKPRATSCNIQTASYAPGIYIVTVLGQNGTQKQLKLVKS